MVTNAGLVGGVIVGLALLVAGVLLANRSPSRAGGLAVTLGALLVLGAQGYGLVVLKPYIGRPYDEDWYVQLTGIENVAMFGLLVCAAGVVAHALRLPHKQH